MLNLLGDIVQQTFWVLYEGALFILAGFAVAGLVHVLIDPDRIVRHLGGRTIRSAALAALLGAPLPLCSCGVLPTAVSLRRKGASPEATLAFLITTPETGIDSVAMTLAFFGPVIAIVRPLAAIATGLVAAFASLRQSRRGTELPVEASLAIDAPDAHRHESDSGTAKTAESAEDRHGTPPTWGHPKLASLLRRVEDVCRQAARHAFTELFDELSFWLVFAFVLTGILSAILPSDFFTRLLPSSFAAMAAMAILSIPLYVCASASTPLAALLVTKGASAGAALVFLLVGPATNAASVATVARLFGRAFLHIYLGAVIGVAIAAGLLLDLLAPGLGASVRIGGPTEADLLSLPKSAAAIGLAWLLLRSLRRTGLRPGIAELTANARAVATALRVIRLADVAASRAVQGLALVALLSTVASSFQRVPVGQRAIVERLGQIRGRPREPGLVFAAPFIDRVELVPVDQVRERPIGYRTALGSLERNPMLDEALYVTADENVIDLHVEAQYRVADPVRYRLGVEAAADVLSALVRSRLVEAMASRSIDFVYTNARAEVESWLLERVRRDAEEADLGLEIRAIRLLDVHAPARVHDAFRDVASAHEDGLTATHVANEYATALVAVARGEAERLISGAEGRAAERVALAKGSAVAFTALAAEHKRSPRLTEDRLYLEKLERVLPGARKIVRPRAGAAKGVELWLRGSGASTVFPPAPGSFEANPESGPPPYRPAAPEAEEGIP